ncbi:MAG TPA: hypothetical protein EYP47_03735 [Methanococcaceae archaeon]|nr:hypothetical protein [Methanococcaceae archaeon]
MVLSDACFSEDPGLVVIDLSDPKNPKLIGKLKIPGYSTYLHPIDEKRLVGIGRDERNRLKISLFKLEDKTKPVEVDRYILPKYYSPALYNPHSFLWDRDNKVLIIPGGNSCYIFKIDRDRISLKMEDIHKGNVLRSLYINSYLYTLSNSQIHIIDMRDWDIVKEITIGENLS